MPTSSTMNRLIENRNKVDARNDVVTVCLGGLVLRHVCRHISSLMFNSQTHCFFISIKVYHTPSLVQYYSKVFGIKWQTEEVANSLQESVLLPLLFIIGIVRISVIQWDLDGYLIINSCKAISDALPILHIDSLIISI